MIAELIFIALTATVAAIRAVRRAHQTEPTFWGEETR